jgi:hypothetical protein
METLKEQLQSLSDFIERKRNTPYKSMYHFVLTEGKEMKGIPLPEKYKRGEMKMCFKNAFDLSINNQDLIYCEGYALTPGLFPILHAWCQDQDGNVIDNTWDNPEEVEYYGVQFCTLYVIDAISDRGCYGVIDSWENGFPLLTGEHPKDVWKLKTIKDFQDEKTK